MDSLKSDKSLSEQEELRRLREENALLKELLTQNGIAWEEPAIPEPVPVPVPAPTESASAPTHFSTDDKIALFRRLFRGREDVYPQRWESTKGTSGYSPACGNEWKPGICHKPRVKCGDCNQRQLLPVTDQVIYDHLAGKQTIGVYPLLSDDSCYFLAADFDEADWREDAKAFMQSCRELGIPAALEVSRSGNGAHAWIFFAEPVPAREARQLGAALISHTCDRTRQLSLASYDRLFPNQDTMPKGGFGKAGRAYLRLCIDRSAPAQPHVGKTSARLPGHGVRDQTDGDRAYVSAPLGKTRFSPSGKPAGKRPTIHATDRVKIQRNDVGGGGKKKGKLERDFRCPAGLQTVTLVRCSEIGGENRFP